MSYVYGQPHLAACRCKISPGCASERNRVKTRRDASTLVRSAGTNRKVSNADTVKGRSQLLAWTVVNVSIGIEIFRTSHTCLFLSQSAFTVYRRPSAPIVHAPKKTSSPGCEIVSLKSFSS